MLCIGRHPFDHTIKFLSGRANTISLFMAPSAVTQLQLHAHMSHPIAPMGWENMSQPPFNTLRDTRTLQSAITCKNIDKLTVWPNFIRFLWKTYCISSQHTFQSTVYTYKGLQIGRSAETRLGAFTVKAKWFSNQKLTMRLVLGGGWLTVWRKKGLNPD